MARWGRSFLPRLGVTGSPWRRAGRLVASTAVVATFAVNAPTIITGGVTTTPSAATAAWAVNTPTNVTTLTPSPVTAAWAANTPTVQIGAVTLTPSAVAGAWSVAAPTTIRGAITLTPNPVVNSQTLVPTSDHAVGSWITTPLFGKVDDNSRIDPAGDGVEISSEAVSSGANTSNADLKIAAGSDPGASSGHILRVYWRNGSEGSATANIIGHCELWQGVPGSGSLITDLSATLGDGVGETGYGKLLSGTEADSITDYTNLYIRLWGQGSGGTGNRSLRVEMVEFGVRETFAVGTPTLSQGTNLTPAAVAAAWSVATPTVVRGALTKTPTPVTATWAVNTPTVISGGGLVTPNPVVAAYAVNAPTLVKGAISRSPTSVTAAFGVAAPTVVKTSTLTASPAVAVWSVATPSRTLGGVTKTPSPVVATWSVATPTAAVTGGEQPLAVLVRDQSLPRYVVRDQSEARYDVLDASDPRYEVDP